MENENVCANKWKEPKYVLTALGMIILGVVVTVSIVREKIVSEASNQVSVTGQGKVTYKPDTAKVILGVQIDRKPTSEQAVNELNERISKIISTLEQNGISKEDIETQNYSVQPQYDYKDGSQTLAGYDANQRFVVKVRDIQSDVQKTGQIISLASQAGSNQMLGVSFEVSSVSDLKQQAKIMAIEDAKQKSQALASAAGIKLGKVVGWYENDLSNPGNPVPYGVGGAAMEKSVSSLPAQIPSGTEDVTIEVSLTYEVK